MVAQLEHGVLALVQVVWGNCGLVVQLVLFMVLASVALLPLVLVTSAAMVGYTVVAPGPMAGAMCQEWGF